ncbi:MAG: transcriptional regulator, Rrf2 [Flavobacterium sp.]|nr:Rrf2 family transcriptional regulator [Planctomycetaceae bacterium]PHS61078.1 MAG: transcriptional regulator, Rrf2 [Flavobacterium sp.]
MRLSLHTDYALRTLMHLATERKRCSIQEIASFYGISRDHLAKVVRRLSQEGYLRTVRGVGGGIELAQKPEIINLGEVLDRLEGPMHLLDCVSVEGICRIQPSCKLKDIFAEAERLQREYLGNHFLIDLIPPDEKLVELKTKVTD